jgi:hypothetical protein
MITKPIFGRLVSLALGVVVLCRPGLFNQPEVVSAGSPEPGQQQPASVESTAVGSRPLKLTLHPVVLSKAKKFNLNLPPGFEITVAALHGSSKRSLRRGYGLMRVRKGGSVQDFITGFLQSGRVYGRPADVMSIGKNAFLFTDDYSGVVYCVFQKAKP